MSETKFTSGPWRWEFNATHKTVQLCGGAPSFDKTVMDFERWGMIGAAPRFMGDYGGFRILHRLPDRKDWISPFPGREHHANWCSAVVHPDARLIESAPELYEALAWYVREDDTREEPGNEPWLEGRDRAIAVLAKARGEQP